MELRGLLIGELFIASRVHFFEKEVEIISILSCLRYLLDITLFYVVFFSSCHICTAGDDHQALIWDIQQMPRPIEDPILAYTAAEGEVNQIQWGPTQPDWIVSLI